MSTAGRPKGEFRTTQHEGRPVSAAAETLCPAYRQAVYDRDVDALAQLYDPDVRVFDTWGRWSHEGAAAWREMLAGWLNGLGEERVQVRFEEVRETGDGLLRLLTAFVRYDGVDATGQPLHGMHNRLSWVAEATPEGWRILHEHTSVPVSMQDLKAQLHRV